MQKPRGLGKITSAYGRQFRIHVHQSYPGVTGLTVTHFPDWPTAKRTNSRGSHSSSGTSSTSH